MRHYIPDALLIVDYYPCEVIDLALDSQVVDIVFKCT